MCSGWKYQTPTVEAGAIAGLPVYVGSGESLLLISDSGDRLAIPERLGQCFDRHRQPIPVAEVVVVLHHPF
ncbi:MAG: hypothetical protein EA001_06275 [Oscillatoriales cyanobacterium]|nr:MAG: hypothetical protein EA001_06275 [Oscillatoriales cyanobacterium]